MILGAPPCPVGCGNHVADTGAGFLCASCWALLEKGDRRRLFEAWMDLHDGLQGASGWLAKVKADLVQVAKAKAVLAS